MASHWSRRCNISIQLGDALLKLSVDTTELEKGLKNVEKRCTDLGKKLMLVGTAITGALIGATIASAKLGDEIAKMSKRTGLGTVALSELRYMAELSGTSLEGLEVGIKRMQMVLASAFSGTPEATKAIEDLGLSIEELKSLSPEEQFYTLASAVASIEDPTLRAAMAQEIFGRSGTMLLPMLEGGAQGLQKMREEAHEYGRIIDEEAAKKSEAFSDALTKLKEGLGKVADAIGTSLMPILTDLLEDKVIPIINRISDWIEKNPQLVSTLGAIGAVIIGAGGILLALGMLAKAIIAVNAALIIMQSLGGPAGWIKIAIGAGIAAAGIAGMMKLMGGLGTATGELAYSTPALPAGGGYVPAELPSETSGETQQYKLGPYGPVPIETPEMQYGGTVPGPKGRPVPIIAHGGEEFLGVQNIKPTQGNMTMNVGLLPGDDVTLRKLARVFKDILGEDSRRTSFGQVNRGYFYGRSST